MTQNPNFFDPSRVTVVDFDMPFWSMVMFMLKWAVAAIPAMIILIVLGGIATAFLASVIRGITAPSLRSAASTRGEATESPEPVAQERPRTPTLADNLNNQQFLQSAIVGVGDSCDEVTRVFYQGGRPSEAMFWNAACRNGKTYSISKAADDTIRVLSCAEIKRMANTDCFVSLDAQH